VTISAASSVFNGLLTLHALQPEIS